MNHRQGRGDPAVWKTLLVLFVGLLAVVAVEEKAPEVCAKVGCVTGVNKSGGSRRAYEAFLGLPYARPPTNRYRWQNPRPQTTWGGVVYNGTYARSECIQMDAFRENEITGDEDCLYLNVYRPKNHKSSLLPVIVYIHGGSFRYGNADPANLGPEYFMEADIILVTVQYRLNVFGFMSSGDENCPGNFGLKDQVQALRWIRRNIQSFGGDPKSVTLMGHGAGAAAVHLHYMSPLSNDLFHRGIALSGTGIADWAFEVNPLKLFRQQIDFSGLSKAVTANNRMSIRELRKLDAKKLFADSLQFLRGTERMTIFKPSIESKSATAFLTDNPKTIWKSGNYKQRPLLLSFVPVEGGAIVPMLKNLQTAFRSGQGYEKLLESTLELKPENLEKAMEMYLTGVEKEQFNMDDVKSVLKMVGDRLFLHPLYETVKDYLSYGNTTDNPIYLMKFEFQGPFSRSKFFTDSEDQNMGVFHGDDLVYYFPNPSLTPEFSKNSLEGKMSHILVQTLVNFAQTSNIQMWQSFEPCTKEVTTETCDYQVFQRYTNSDPHRIAISVRNSFDLDMTNFWDEILDNNFQ